MEEIARELEYVKDPDLLRKYALWLVARDVDRGLSVSCFALPQGYGEPADRTDPLCPK